MTLEGDSQVALVLCQTGECHPRTWSLPHNAENAFPLPEPVNNKVWRRVFTFRVGHWITTLLKHAELVLKVVSFGYSNVKLLEILELTKDVIQRFDWALLVPLRLPFVFVASELWAKYNGILSIFVVHLIDGTQPRGIVKNTDRYRIRR
ncbi:hypothetical protein NX059_011056 [Plenodomus lindquistii]|nr:hypothetical protein NX059_011056 [Plenodomus lindquistii]